MSATLDDLTELRPSTGAPGRAEQAVRIADALVRCVARWGVAKTTLDDVAREAGCSRATVYRLVPGGKEGLLELAATVEVERFFAGVAERLRVAHDLENLLVLGMAEAGRRIRDHAALQFLLAHEPEAVVPHLAFARMDTVLQAAGAFTTPYLERWLTPHDAERAAEWVVRLVLSYASTPAPGVDIADDVDVRRLVRSFVLPGLLHHVTR